MVTIILIYHFFCIALTVAQKQTALLVIAAVRDITYSHGRGSQHIRCTNWATVKEFQVNKKEPPLFTVYPDYGN